MVKTTPEQNKTLVLQAFDTLFQQAGLQRGRAVLVIELHSSYTNFRGLEPAAA